MDPRLALHWLVSESDIACQFCFLCPTSPKAMGGGGA
jgi:hypothetical protein